MRRAAIVQFFVETTGYKGSHSLDFGRMGLRHEGKPLALSSGGGSGSIGRLFRTTTLGSRLRVRRPRSMGQNILIVDCFSSLFARVQDLIVRTASSRQ